MRFHILGLPHTVSSKEYNACAYTQKVVKFCKMMSKRGHTCIHYGHEDSVVDAEHVTVLTNEDFKKTYGNYNWRNNFFKFDVNDDVYHTFYQNAILEVGKRKQQNDFILPFWGSGVRPVVDAHPDMIAVEPGIGYAEGHWCRFKIFESYAIYHAYLGLSNVKTCRQCNYEVVIPNYFDPDDFEYSSVKDDYFLYLGRVYEGKGVHIAYQVADKLGLKLLIAGQNSLSNIGIKNTNENIIEIGYADVKKRKELMSKAKASFVLSQYLGPFEGVQVENLLSGTPTITTDWGCFSENNLHGITGFRCRTFNDILQAVKNIDTIKPENCRKFGENFLMDKVAIRYEKYFQDVLDIFAGNGWYQEHLQDNTGILKLDYPCSL
jgi:glycosyltransferase involved in cell wall biosynthesis